MRRTIGVVTVARSDYGHLRPLLAEIRDAPNLTPQLFVAGGHLAERFGRTVREIEADGWHIAGRVETVEAQDDGAAIARALGRAVTGFAEALTRHRPDLLLVLGDRYEMLGAALAALPLLVPVAHVHGGEITEGAIDEQLRHALTKLAHVHFVAAEPFARRLAQMGEEAWRIHTVGAPGLDRFRTMGYLDREALAQRLGVALTRPVVLVTFHPVTLEPHKTDAHVTELLSALDQVDATLVVSSPGADTASAAIIRRLEEFAAARPRVRFVSSLGDDVYASLLREADAMVGNSSSGLIEAPSFALPVVNVGHRQGGRLRAANVIDVDHDRAAIATGIRRALEPAFRASLKDLGNPYGDGHASPRIARVLAEVPLAGRLVTKRFVDLPVSR
jgi:UDP-hydrolysing UDP-N-acetyl-D-glucosamine 2-epimerase